MPRAQPLKLVFLLLAALHLSGIRVFETFLFSSRSKLGNAVPAMQANPLLAQDSHTADSCQPSFPRRLIVSATPLLLPANAAQARTPSSEQAIVPTDAVVTEETSVLFGAYKSKTTSTPWQIDLFNKCTDWLDRTAQRSLPVFRQYGSIVVAAYRCVNSFQTLAREAEEANVVDLKSKYWDKIGDHYRKVIEDVDSHLHKVLLGIQRLQAALPQRSGNDCITWMGFYNDVSVHWISKLRADCVGYEELSNDVRGSLAELSEKLNRIQKNQDLSSSRCVSSGTFALTVALTAVVEFAFATNAAAAVTSAAASRALYANQYANLASQISAAAVIPLPDAAEKLVASNFALKATESITDIQNQLRGFQEELEKEKESIRSLEDELEETLALQEIWEGVPSNKSTEDVITKWFDMNDWEAYLENIQEEVSNVRKAIKEYKRQ